MLKSRLSPRQKSPSPQDYERLGRMLADLYQTGYPSGAKFYKYSFLKGLITGLGGVIGATLVVGLLIWLLSLFSSVPLVGRLVHNVQQTIESGRRP